MGGQDSIGYHPEFIWEDRVALVTIRSSYGRTGWHWLPSGVHMGGQGSIGYHPKFIWEDRVALVTIRSSYGRTG